MIFFSHLPIRQTRFFKLARAAKMDERIKRKKRE
jgi:hypothetical protein